MHDDVNVVRRSDRYRIRKFITCRSAAYGGFEGQMINVSEVGVMLRSRQPIEIDADPESASPISLVLTLPQEGRSKNTQVALEAIPVWSEQRGPDGQFEIGFKWSRLSLPKRLMIKHWQRYCADPAI